MIAFDPHDPYPLLPAEAYRLADEQAHAAAVDDWLGLRTQATEAAIASAGLLSDGMAQQLWVGLPVQSMLTPYVELRRLLADLAPAAGTTVIDLGAGYGRMGFVLGRHHPGVRFMGYEWVDERVREGRRALERWGYAGVSLMRADLSDAAFAPEPAELYFLYDFGTRDAIDKTLRDLAVVARARPITVVGRGRASRDAIERRHPWLSAMRRPEHHARYSIYRSA